MGWVVGDGLDWVRIFGCGLKVDKRGCIIGGSGLKLARSGLNMSESEQEWPKNEQEWAEKSGNRWQSAANESLDRSAQEQTGIGGSGWECMEVGGSRWEWKGVDESGQVGV